MNLFQLIDLDRTLFNTKLFAKAITDQINLLEPGYGTELDKRFEAAYRQEETFFMFRLLRKERGDARFEALAQRAVGAIGADSLKLPGVDERTRHADDITSHRPAWGVMTYGDEIDQRLKLSLIGLADAPLLMTPTADKAALVRSWQNPDKTFTLPREFGGGTVDALTLEDDKLRAFTNMPEGMRGYWMTGLADATDFSTTANVAAKDSQQATHQQRLHEAIVSGLQLDATRITIAYGLEESLQAIRRDFSLS